VPTAKKLRENAAKRPAVERVRQAIARALRRAGLRPGDQLVVACSFGPDSLALADAVCTLARPLALGALTLVYVDHGLRAEAAAEAEQVRALATARGVAAEVRRVEVRRDGHGPEDAARRARHAALESVRQQVRARWVLYGHTASDQAETLILRLLRGTGPAGLAGMAQRRGARVRPMLDLTRADVDAYLAARGLSPAQDASNRSRAYTRNRVRHEILPALRRENPRVEQGLARLASAQGALVRGMRQVALASLASLADDAGLAADGVRALPAGLAALVLAEWLAGQGVTAGPGHLSAVLGLAEGRRATLPGAVVGLLGGRWRLDDARAAAPWWHAVRVTVEGLPAGWRARWLRPGDRLRPGRLGGRSRKLSDLLAESGVPAAERAGRVVIEAPGGVIVWAEGLGAAYEAVLRVALTRMDPGVTTGLPAGKSPGFPSERASSGKGGE
jgi:tRNA(Ile)-lysidine synthase